MAKMGRPSMDDPRTLSLTYKVSKAEKQAIKECAEQHKMTVTAFIREAINSKIEESKNEE